MTLFGDMLFTIKMFINERRKIMAISRAVQNGDWVDLYDMNNHQLFTQMGTLYGYTSGSVSIKRSSGWIITYDENAHEISSDYSG